ncbi:MAG: response regulator transcription factor [Myxococcota bacterium]
MPEEQRALVVDDDPVSRQFVADTLTRHGIRAYASADAEAGLASFARNGPFDLLVVDLLLPGVRGTQMVRELEKTHTGLRVLYVSARATAPPSLGPCQRFLAKPFTTGELMAEVRTLLPR